MSESKLEIIERLANENYICCEFWEEDGNVVAVEVHRGDWKHSHLLLKKLVRDKFPELKWIESEVTEDDGSDCYSAIHRFHF